MALFKKSGLKRSGKLLQRAAKALDLTAIWIGGPPGKVLRMEMSKNPRQRFRLMVANCVSGHEAEYAFEGWVAGASDAARLMETMIEQATSKGEFFGPDRYAVAADTLIRRVLVGGDRLGIRVYRPEDIRDLKLAWLSKELEKNAQSRRQGKR